MELKCNNKFNDRTDDYGYNIDVKFGKKGENLETIRIFYKKTLIYEEKDIVVKSFFSELKYIYIENIIKNHKNKKD